MRSTRRHCRSRLGSLRHLFGSGVVQTVYFVFHTKGELLRQLLQTVGGRPEDPTETMERDWVEEAITDPDGRRSIALMIEYGNDIYARIAPVWAAVGQGAAVKPEVAEVWRGIVEQRRKGIRRIVESLGARGQLREGVSVDRAADIVYGLHRPETLAVFVGERGWPLEGYKEWFYSTLCHQLLSPQPTRDQERSPTRGLTFGRGLPWLQRLLGSVPRHCPGICVQWSAQQVQHTAQAPEP